MQAEGETAGLALKESWPEPQDRRARAQMNGQQAHCVELEEVGMVTHSLWVEAERRCLQ